MASSEAGSDAVSLASWWRSMASGAKPREPRQLLAFAESELVLPDGPHKGRPFRRSVQPWAGLWLAAVDRAIREGSHSRFLLTGPTQSGKTLCGFVLPVLWVLFELQETCCIGAPDMVMCSDKLRMDLLPAIRAGRFASMLPDRGSLSRGGTTDHHLVQFGSAALRMMHARGGDKTRAGFTARACVMTEIDGMDQAGAASREADPVTQMEQRVAAYGERGLVFLECTVSTESGRTWQEWSSGSRSRLCAPCVQCGAWVSPEREQLVGWQEAADEIAAAAGACWACPECGCALGEDERRSMVESARLVHGEQEVREGVVVGAAPATRTLALRLNAFWNLFSTTGQLGGGEWKARQEGSDGAERARRQFVWSLPASDAEEGEEGVSAAVLSRIDRTRARGVVPGSCATVAAGVDVGRHALYWTCAGFDSDDRVSVLSYGVQDVPTADMGEDLALGNAFRQLLELFAVGFVRAGSPGECVPPALVLVDSGYRSDLVYRLAAESGGVARPSKGRGAGQRATSYRAPRRRSSAVVAVGSGWHVSRLAGGVQLVEFDSDHWKSWLHARIMTPPGQVGCFSLFEADSRAHVGFAKHLDSERRSTVWMPRAGFVEQWRPSRAANHWLDSTVLAMVARSMVEALSGRQSRSASASASGPALRELESPGRAVPSPGRRKALRSVSSPMR